jgi:hypothetical protein
MKKLLFTATARPALAARAAGPLMLRGAQVTFSPDEDLGGGDDTPEEFREQPGDREPEPEAEAALELEPEAEAEAEAEEEPEAEAEPAAAAEGEEDPEPEEPAEEGSTPKKNWKDRQIIKLRTKEREDAAERERLRKENEELRAAAAAGEEGGTVLTAAEREKIRAEAADDIRRENYVKKLNQSADAMFDAGMKAFPKTWEARVKDVGEVFADEIRARPEFLEAVTDLENGAAVYHELAGDPDEMERVLELPPHKMGMELAKLSAKLSAAPKPKPISRAPPPITPLAKPGVQDRSLDDLANDPSPAAQAEFNRRMDVEERKKAEAR